MCSLPPILNFIRASLIYTPLENVNGQYAETVQPGGLVFDTCEQVRVQTTKTDISLVVGPGIVNGVCFQLSESTETDATLDYVPHDYRCESPTYTRELEFDKRSHCCRSRALCVWLTETKVTLEGNLTAPKRIKSIQLCILGIGNTTLFI